MEQLTNITEVSRALHISTRTLRYYEQIGLISSLRTDDYAYRMYDEKNLYRLRQIVVLRKLCIPLKQIAVILQSERTSSLIDVFCRRLAEVDDEITALSTIRDILDGFLERLREATDEDISVNLLDDPALLEAVDALTVHKTNPKPAKTADDLTAAATTLNRLNERDVRILYLPPMRVLSFHSVGEAPELVSDTAVQEFLRTTEFAKTCPASRHFGFNHDEGDIHGYERWLILPDGTNIPENIPVKTFPGGLYAVTCAMMGEWERWDMLLRYFDGHERYEVAMNGTTAMGGLLEEHLNYWNWYEDPGLSMEENDRTKQLDLYLPVRRK